MEAFKNCILSIVLIECFGPESKSFEFLIETINEKKARVDFITCFNNALYVLLKPNYFKHNSKNSSNDLYLEPTIENLYKLYKLCDDKAKVLIIKYIKTIKPKLSLDEEIRIWAISIMLGSNE